MLMANSFPSLALFAVCPRGIGVSVVMVEGVADAA